MTKTAPSPSGWIHRLDQRLINQIAAGEVIVRPASAVKELIENSLDAGATRIEIAVEEDARSFSIADDGSGMSAADARLSIERYATSKIRELDDLANLNTRGFRGEALAAISAVSRFELQTRRAEDAVGAQLRCEGGTGARLTQSGLPAGTTIRVRDLFFNTPARLKFMRSAVAEWGHILKEFLRQALTRPDVGFSIKWRGRPYLNLPSGQTLRERLAAILPSEAGGDLLDVDHTLHDARAWGCVSSPKTTRRDRRHQYFFVNGRPIVSRPLTFALQEAYKGLIMTQQFPLAALFLELPNGEVDVNVHPAKEEIRFRNEALAAGSVHRAALEALRKAELVPKLSLPATPGTKFAQQPIASVTSAHGDSIRPPGFFASPTRPTDQAIRVNPIAPSSDQTKVTAEEIPLSPSALRLSPYTDDSAVEEATLIGRIRASGEEPLALAQIARTYILAEVPRLGMLLVDQHAAHEKILYLQYQRDRRKGAIQDLLVPYTYEASPAERPALEALAPLLAEEGFATEHFGGGTFVVQSVPVLFEKTDVSGLLRDLLDEIGQGNVKRELDRLRHKIGAMAACRAAIKAGDPLTQPQMQALLDQVLETSEALRCPHGRPTLLLLTKEQLDRQFGRI